MEALNIMERPSNLLEAMVKLPALRRPKRRESWPKLVESGRLAEPRKRRYGAGNGECCIP